MKKLIVAVIFAVATILASASVSNAQTNRTKNLQSVREILLEISSVKGLSENIKKSVSTALTLSRKDGGNNVADLAPVARAMVQGETMYYLSRLFLSYLDDKDRYNALETFGAMLYRLAYNMASNGHITTTRELVVISENASDLPYEDTAQK